jgi:hypothetical protein
LTRISLITIFHYCRPRLSKTNAVLRKTIAANKAFAELKSASEPIPKLLDLLPGRKADMSKNPEFLDTFLECVQAANIFLSVFIWL